MAAEDGTAEAEAVPEAPAEVEDPGTAARMLTLWEPPHVRDESPAQALLH